MKKMKIGIVVYPTFGGSGVVGTELGKALAKKGYEIHFITYSQPVRLGSFRQNIYYHEVSVSDYPLFEYQPYETVLASKMVDVVKHENLDLLHVHYAIPHASAALMAKNILHAQGIDIPFITTLHGTDITLVGRDPSFEPVISYCLNQSDAVTAVSESLKQDTYTHFATNKPIEVIPNFISFNQIVNPETNTGLRAMYANDHQKVVCHISNFRKVKRVEDVIAVFNEIVKHVDAKLLLVGDGPERTAMEAMCRKLNLCDRIEFIGKVRDTSQVLSISDLFLLPSETESFGLAALEAMAEHVPVISSNTGGIPEVNEHGVSGFLSAVGDVQDMAKNAIHLLSNDELLKQFKNQAFKRAQEFDLENILPLYEALYERVVEESSSPVV